MMYCKVCFGRDGSFNSKTVQATCINEKTGVQFEAWVCTICRKHNRTTRVTCHTFTTESSTEFEPLSPAEIEDCLGIYKDVLSGRKPPSSLSAGSCNRIDTGCRTIDRPIQKC